MKSKNEPQAYAKRKANAPSAREASDGPLARGEDFAREASDGPLYVPRTDLACEAPTGKADAPRGCESDTYHRGGIAVTRLRVTDGEGAQRLGRPVGTYVTVSLGNPLGQTAAARAAAVGMISSELRRMAEALLGEPIRAHHTVLVAGLGNARMTPDAVGPETVRKLTVTRHFTASDSALLHALSGVLPSIAAIAPGVCSETGIGTAQLCRAVADAVSPDLVIAVDALAARSCSRLASTVQLSDAGICPGSGVGLRADALSREVLGCPVLSVGVPTVVDSSALVYDALSRAGITEGEISPELRSVLENGTRFFVSPKELDAHVAYFSDLLSEAIEAALRVDFPKSVGENPLFS